MSVLDRPVIEVRAVLADESEHVRTWTINDDPHPDLLVIEPDEWPNWMVEPRRSWEHPQDPITYSFKVAEGREGEALAWLAAL